MDIMADMSWTVLFYELFNEQYGSADLAESSLITLAAVCCVLHNCPSLRTPSFPLNCENKEVRFLRKAKSLFWSHVTS